ncbi:MAG TPA: hypothetical protein VIG24_05675 [Acidimicrobiia bacterium]
MGRSSSLGDIESGTCRIVVEQTKVSLTAACGALVLGSMAPAGAANLSGQDVATAYSIMMTSAQGKSLVGGSKMMNVFAVSNSGAGSVDNPWLCDLSGTDEVEGRGGDDIVKKIKRCEGQQQPSGDEDGVDGDEPGGLTTQLTNGTKKAADGDAFLWVRSLTTIPGVDGFAEHDYTTVRHFGKYLQIIQVEEEGSGAMDLTKKQIRRADRLTDSLGDRWRATFS